jgi:hypothetical protein
MRKRSHAIWFARFTPFAIVLCGVFVLGGCGTSTPTGSGAKPTATATVKTAATPTASTSVTPTAQATQTDFSTFRSSDGSYTINFPSTWGTRPLTAQGITAQLFGTVDQVDVFAVLPIKQTISSDKYPTIIEGFLGKDGVGGTDIRVFPVTTSVTIKSATWTRLTTVFMLQNTPNSLVGYVTTHGSNTFALLFYAPDSTFAGIDTSDFEPMAQSFSFSS